MSVKGRSKLENKYRPKKAKRLKFPHDCPVNVHGTDILVPSIGPTWEEGEKEKKQRKEKRTEQQKDEQKKKKLKKKKKKKNDEGGFVIF